MKARGGVSRPYRKDNFVLVKKCIVAAAISIALNTLMYGSFHLYGHMVTVINPNIRSIEAVAVSADTLKDTTGNLWGYDGLTTGTTYTVTFNTCGTDDVTDDIIMEVR